MIGIFSNLTILLCATYRAGVLPRGCTAMEEDGLHAVDGSTYRDCGEDGEWIGEEVFWIQSVPEMPEEVARHGMRDSSREGRHGWGDGRNDGGRNDGR